MSDDYLSDDYLLTDYLLVRVGDLHEWDDLPTLRKRAEGLRKGRYTVAALLHDAVVNAYVLRDAPFVRDRNDDVWEKQDDGSYCRERFGGTLGSLVLLAGKYGPLTPCEAPGPPEPTAPFTIVAVRGGDGSLRRFVLIGTLWVRFDGASFAWDAITDSGEVLSVTPPPEGPS